MSMFSIIRRSRQQAKEHNAKQAERSKEEAVKLPYKHVPTHAAIDALSVAPSGSQHEYRPRILEENRRRSAMITTPAAVGSSGLPRVGSSLSYVSYPSNHATPIGPLPKNYSFSSVPATWRESGYPREDYFGHPAGRKGKEKEPLPPLPAGAISKVRSARASIQSVQAGSSIRSSKTSSGSDEDLEIRPARHGVKLRSPGARPSRHNSTGSDNAHHLHPAHQQKASVHSDRHLDRYYPPSSRNTHFKAAQPMNPQAMTLNPPVPGISTLHTDSPTTSPAVSGPVSCASSAASIVGAGSTAPSSTASMPVFTTFASFLSTEEYSAESLSVSRTPRFSEVPTFPMRKDTAPMMAPSAAATDATIRQLDEAVGQSTANYVAEPSSRPSRRLSKAAPQTKLAKEAKKTRWSLKSSKVPAAVVAV